jgi:hypothetical protein
MLFRNWNQNLYVDNFQINNGENGCILVAQTLCSYYNFKFSLETSNNIVWKVVDNEK